MIGVGAQWLSEGDFWDKMMPELAKSGHGFQKTAAVGGDPGGRRLQIRDRRGEL